MLPPASQPQRLVCGAVSLVPDFAQRLERNLGLPFHPVLKKTDNRPEQKTKANSAQQARNIDGSLAVTRQRIVSGSVLLIDEMVDSRWTMTVAAWLLRTHGSGAVFL
jgi:ATP-dependent DNA helicase RecQ